MDTLTATDRVHALIEEVKEGVARVQGSEDWKRWLDMCSRFWRYSFCNQMLIAIQQPTATQVAGFNTWKNLGRWVRKGETGIRILAPLVAKVEDPATGTKEPRVVGFKSVCVFDAAQTDGESLPEVYHPLKGQGPAGVFMEVKQFAESKGYTVAFGKVPPPAYGFVNDKKQIVLKEGEDMAHSLKTLCHELSHGLLGHVGNGDLSAAEKELEAETAAWVICRNLGLETKEASFSYLATWAPGKERDAALERAARRACEVAKEVLSGLDPDFGDLDG